VEQGIAAYITSRRASIPGFVGRHFSVRGALALHRKPFGRGVSKHPGNLWWGLPVALGNGVAALLDKAGANRTATRLHRLPRGIPTGLPRELHWLLSTALWERPSAQAGRASSRDALRERILAEPWIAARCDGCLTQPPRAAARPGFRGALERQPGEYGNTRGAVSELAGSLSTLAAGSAALSQAPPGALSAATAIARRMAVANCRLGATVGAWDDAVFPVSASAGLVAATPGAMIAAVGVVTAPAGIVLDPPLATTGLHRRRPDRLVTAVGAALRGGRRGEYRVREHSIARVVDVLELLRAATQA
jgi:hypothetical protein